MLFETVSSYYGKLEGISSRLEMIDVLTQMFHEVKASEVRKLIYMTQGVLAPPFEGVEIGIAEKLVSESIARASGYEKEQVYATYKKTGDMGLAAEQTIAKTKLRRMSSRKFSLIEVFDMLHKIATTSGPGSQDGKIRMMSELLAASSPVEARYITRFAMGTLRLGLGDATILEALSKTSTGERKMKSYLENAYNLCSDLGEVGEALFEGGIGAIEHFKVTLFKPIRPALAERLPTAEEILEKMRGRCSVESKYDGFRVQVHVDKKSKRVEIFSRRLEKVTHMFPEIVKAALEELDFKSAIFDGEAIAYNDVTGEYYQFQETIQRKRKHGIEEKSAQLPLHVFAFDLMYSDGEDYMTKPYKERRRKLEDIVAKNGIVRLSDEIIATRPRELEKYFENAVSNGLEGIVAKDMESFYVAGARKFSWIKMKRSYKGELSDTVDLVIIGYYLGRGQRAEFKFGGLLCASYNDKTDMFESVTRIGTGFSEKQMVELQKLLDKAKTKTKPARVASIVVPDFWVDPKYVVETRADEITRSPMHLCGMEKLDDGSEAGYALRFPRLISDGVRTDKSAEEATTTKEIIEMFGMQKKIRVADA
ncbi:MAG: ATP-dependent DNA ligase [Candidatus Micrarchaeota archaeon]|nr:ATP-dependent DNA ligase [Candidatus Micrarchaeota archaeon]MDE1847331.1 ATP-dependent DNA ligase [Candidatus Micrarchaeota archaeon]MDE1863946.1 ATP-dependent DNA ligase [Candidatus Micrarchaeota archaeon]